MPTIRPAAKRTEHEVEADVVGEQHERGEQEQRQAHRGLAGRVHGVRSTRDDPRRARAQRHRGADSDDGAEHDQQDRSPSPAP